MIDNIIGAVVAGVLAWVGGWLGARFGLQRFRQERVFERRLEWYRDMHQVLVSIDTTLNSMQLATERNEM